MKLEIFGKYELKDGRVGWVVDILGDGEALIFEVDKKGFDDRVITVFKNEISKKVA